MPKHQYEAKMVDFCPVTNMEFVSSNSRKKPNWKYVTFNSDYMIGYYEFDNRRPLTQFQVQEDAPCMDRSGAFSYEQGLKEDFY